MSIPLPNLDDRTFEELVAEARSLIPTVYPAWTDHNPSDSGMVLIELLAWLSEMMLYQVDGVADQHVEVFLQYLNGADWTLAPDADLSKAVHETILAIHERYRAVTADDYEYLVRTQWPDSPQALELGPAARLERAHCLPRYYNDMQDVVRAVKHLPDEPDEGHVTVVVVPPAGNDSPQPAKALQRALWEFLDDRRLLGVQHHVIGPAYPLIRIQAECIAWKDANISDACTQARAKLLDYFHPLHGGPDQTGWPLGRSVYASEIYSLLETVPTVDYVENVTLSRGTEHSNVEIALRRHELVKLDLAALVATDHGREFWYPKKPRA